MHCIEGRIRTSLEFSSVFSRRRGTLSNERVLLVRTDRAQENGGRMLLEPRLAGGKQTSSALGRCSAARAG